MSKLNFGDIVALAKAGYKYAEVKELLALDLPETNEAPAPVQAPEKVNPEPTPEQTTPTLDDNPTPAKATGQQLESEQDKARIAELEKQIKDLQATNQSKDVSGNVPDPQKDLDDIVRSFM